jgi:predicted GTPase
MWLFILATQQIVFSNQQKDFFSKWNQEKVLSFIQSEILKAFENKTSPRVNVLIIGKTGVGKSTLVNAIFQGNLATSGKGKPVTQYIEEHSKPGIPIAIYDTPGFELKRFDAIVHDIQQFLEKMNSAIDSQKHIHVSWICVNEEINRIESGEKQFSDALLRYTPVIEVITKSYSGHFLKKAKQLLPKITDFIEVVAKKKKLRDGMIISPFGLEDLVNATMKVLPTPLKMPFIAAQKASLEQKRESANFIVMQHVTAMIAICVSPIPFWDIFLLISNEVLMAKRINLCFGLHLGDETILESIHSEIIINYFGRSVLQVVIAIFANFLKLLPGVGSTFGYIISAASASVFTNKIGKRYITTLQKRIETRFLRIFPDKIFQELKKIIKRNEVKYLLKNISK